MKANDFVVDTTLVGVALNGLSHLVGVGCKGEFACALVRGLGGNLAPNTQEKFAKEVHSIYTVVLQFTVHVVYSSVL